MHLQSCEHPKRIYNKYLKEFMYVPCGTCPSCLRSKASQWIQRLDVERKCWKYCVFYTLTYADEHVPMLSKLGDDYLVDLSHKHTAPDKNSPCIDLKLLKSQLLGPDVSRLNIFLSKFDKIPYLSVYDSQCFIKRLRKNLKNHIKNNYSIYDEKDYQVRYYHIGEYGSTTYRCHYHGLLFFSSEKEAACIEEIIRKSWKLGIVDVSFVSDTNSSYLAKYLNCTTGLPKIYEHKDIRPFSIFSKSVPLGTLFFNEQKVREIFDSASPTMSVTYFKQLSPVNVHLWRTFEDRLFPKLSLFDRFSHSDRIILYRASLYFAERYPGFANSVDFASFMMYRNRIQLYDPGYLHLYDDYIEALKDNSPDYRSSIQRWFNLSSRICTQAAAFDVSVSSYVSQIELYYANKDKEQLKDYFTFQVDYAEQYNPIELIGLDKLWLESIIDVPLEDLTSEEIHELQSFGIDPEKFASPDLSISMAYQEYVYPENTRDFLNVVIDNNAWLKKHTKTKIKNDYLQSHPELALKMRDLVEF